MFEWFHQQWLSKRRMAELQRQSLAEAQHALDCLDDLTFLIRAEHERRQESLPPPNGVERRKIATASK